MKRSSTRSVPTLALGAMMTALVILFQLLATYTAFFGPFSTAMALIPIVIGAALCGRSIGAWLGFVFGLVVLLSGGANLFLGFHIPGTVLTVLVKGTACGLVAGWVYQLVQKHSKTVAVAAASVICPIVNTGVFLLGCYLFFLPQADAIAEAAGMNVSGFSLFLTMATANFLIEIIANLVLSPIIVRVVQIKSKLGK